MQTPSFETTPPGEAIAAYYEIRSSLSELARDELLPLPQDLTRSIGNGLKVASSAIGDRQRFIDVYRNPPLELIDSLRTRALALRGAAIVTGSSSRERGTDDIERARKLRARHVTLIRAIFFGDETMEARLSQTVLNRCAEQSGSALLALAALERKHWELISTTGLISVEEVAELEALGRGISIRKGALRGEWERRAWTAMSAACRCVRDHAYILYCRDLMEWDRLYPSLERKAELARTPLARKTHGSG